MPTATTKATSITTICCPNVSAVSASMRWGKPRQGQYQEESGNARHRSRRRGDAQGDRANHRAGRQEAGRHVGGPALHHRRRTETGRLRDASTHSQLQPVAVAGLRPVATLKIRINDEEYEQTSSATASTTPLCARFARYTRSSSGASSRCWSTIRSRFLPAAGPTLSSRPTLPGNTGARRSRTRGLDADQTEAAIKATLKMLNKLENMQA